MNNFYYPMRVGTRLVGLALVATVGLGQAAPASSDAVLAVNQGRLQAGLGAIANGAATAKLLATTAADQVYVPITPCRIIDTRRLFGGPGPLLANSTTAFDAVASTFAAQGGSASDCGIPAGATAVAASVGMVNALGLGDLRAWAIDATMPNASIGVFNPAVTPTPSTGQVTFNGSFAVIPLCTTACTGNKEFQIFAESAQVDLVVDVNGYFHALTPTTAFGQGLSWGTIARNTIGSATAQLRNDASAPLGTGSLQLTIGAGTDKVEFGDEISFAGKPLSDITAIGYQVKTTGENSSANNTVNMPSIAIEVFSNAGGSGTGYTTLNYSPNTNTAANTWASVDAANDTSNAWGLTGSAYNNPATAANCGINGARCTFAQAKAVIANATIISIAIGKGRDFAWNGQVDGLWVNTTTYDFEFGGVKSTP